MEFRFTWHNSRVGACVWAPVGGYGWREAVIESLGRKNVSLVFAHDWKHAAFRVKRGKREYSQLRLRDPKLNGKDKPTPLDRESDRKEVSL